MAILMKNSGENNYCIIANENDVILVKELCEFIYKHKKPR